MGDLDPSYAVTVDDLARCLNQLHVGADMPTLRTLEQRTGEAAGGPLPGTQLRSVRLGRTTLNDVLRGRKFPGKAFLLTFVEACGINLETDRRWEEAWDRLAPQYRGQADGQETDPRQGLAEIRAQAEAVSQQLRQQLAESRAQTEQAEAASQQLRQQLAESRAQTEQAEAANEQLRQPSAPARRSIHSTQDSPASASSHGPGPLRRWDPERIGPYSLLGRLGGGAMGQVYLGRSAAGRLVAVKTIKIEFAEEPGFRARFAHEVAAARRVSGVFTAAVVAADQEADVPWLATAYVPAPSLSHLVRACGPLPVPAVRWLAAGCAEALESIHSAGLVHRDLKPSNVLVSPDGPRVIDFGVARAAERIHLTVTRGAIGTPAYMAPEQARDTRQASLASDIFSLGATLLFAATGHSPYQGDTVMDILVRLATESPDLGSLPAELTGVITACLQRSPRKRPTSSALLAQLAPHVESASGHGLPPLPDPAIAMIAEFQRNPGAGSRGDDSPGQDGASLPSVIAASTPRRRRRYIPRWYSRRSQ